MNVFVFGCYVECWKGLEGVYVGINYGVNVMVSGNIFIVSDSMIVIVEEMFVSFVGVRNK